MRAGVLELLVPSTMPNSEREHWAEVMSRRLARRAERARPSDQGLQERARRLNERHFEGRLRWASIGFAEMDHLWGSCTFTAGAIRIARRAGSRPAWGLDYLLMPQHAQLVLRGHGPYLHRLQDLYRRVERRN